MNFSFFFYKKIDYLQYLVALNRKILYHYCFIPYFMMNRDDYFECECGKCERFYLCTSFQINIEQTEAPKDEIGEDDPKWIFDPKKSYKSDDDKSTKHIK